MEDAGGRLEKFKKGSLSADGQEYTFDIKTDAGLQNLKFNFYVKVSQRQPNPAITNYLKLNYN